jgi:hypothetical protein
MKTLRALWLAQLVLGASATVASKPAAAQLTARQSAVRDAAITRCGKQALQLYRGDSKDQWRWHCYAACVTMAGFQP